jgi:hypothetical protein
VAGKIQQKEGHSKGKALILLAHRFRCAKPVFAEFAKWNCGKATSEQAKNVFANFFRFKPAQQASIPLKIYILIEKS